MHARSNAVAILSALALFSLTLPVAGCGAGEPNPPLVEENPPPADPVGLRDRLALGPTFEVAGPRSRVELTAHVVTQQTEATPTAVAVLGGTVTVRATAAADEGSAIVVESLDVAFDDVVISDQDFPPEGLHLTGLRVLLPEPVACDPYWSDAEDEVVAEPVAEVVLEWAVLAENGTLVPLAPQRFADMPIALRVSESEDGTLVLAVEGGAEGTFWSWGGLVEMSDLSFALVGVAE